MAAAENDALPGGKIGGIGDVVRDIAPALASLKNQVQVVNPGYQYFSTLNGAKYIDRFECAYGGKKEPIELFQVPAKKAHKNVCIWVLEHPLFALGGQGEIYCNDPSDQPFARDARKFALFCAAVAKATCLGLFGKIDVLHLHDWHAAMIAVLREYDPAYATLKSMTTVYSIHNLSLQGVRPFSGNESSLEAWFPSLRYHPAQINDPRATHCLNPMRAGITLCDHVHAVSPSYAREILQPSQPEKGQFGGEGLEADLALRLKQGRLHGILNGCEYPSSGKKAKPKFKTLLQQSSKTLLAFIGKSQFVDSSHFIAQQRLNQLSAQYTRGAPELLITSVGRKRH